MTDYNVNFTDANMNPITVPEDTVNRNSLDVTLFGRMFQNYGEEVNEDLLNILENFACPESELVTDEISAYPDTSQTSKTQLQNPVDGQFWYNSTRQSIYFYDGTKWVPVPKRGTYAANWGQVMHGQQLPKPVNQHGKVFDYDECIWSVAPANINGTIDSMNCNTNAVSLVTMQYRYANTEIFVNGIANYLIVGINGNMNSGAILPPIQPSPTPTPSVSSTPAPTNTPTPSLTPTITAQPTPTVTPTTSVTPTPTSVPSPTPQVSPSPQVSPTPAPTVTPSAAPISYCYYVTSMCMGYGDSTLVWTPLRRDSPTTTPASGYCSGANVTPHSCNGRIIRVNTNMANTHPSIKFIIRVVASNGQSTGDMEVFARMNTSASTSASETINLPFTVNGVTHTMIVNANWYKSDGNNNAAIGTLTGSYSFNTGIGHC